MIPAIAFAEPYLNEVPTSCKSAYMEQIEKINIPNILGLTDNDASIVEIIPAAAATSYYQYVPGLYKINCFITVVWSNGNTDSFYEFSAWQNQYDQVMVSYGPQGEDD